MTGLIKRVVAEGVRLSVCNLIYHKGINSTEINDTTNFRLGFINSVSKSKCWPDTLLLLSSAEKETLALNPYSASNDVLHVGLAHGMMGSNTTVWPPLSLSPWPPPSHTHTIAISTHPPAIIPLPYPQSSCSLPHTP